MKIDEKETFLKLVDMERKYIPIIRQLLKEYGPCPQCGKCCKIERLSTSMKEAENLKKLDPEFFEKALFKKWDNFVSFKSPCPYLKKDNRCRAYNLRPFVCKIYPFLIVYVDMASIIYCPYGESIISDITEFCSQRGISISEPTEKQQEEIDSVQTFFDEKGLSTGDVQTKVMNIPYEALDEFIKWKNMKKIRRIR